MTFPFPTEERPLRIRLKSRRPLPGVAYYGYRYYDPVTGRWPSRDPIEESGGINLYGFLGSDGVNEVDVLGKNAFAFFIAGFVNTIGHATLPICYEKPCKQGSCRTCVTAIGVALHVTAQVGLAAALSACVAGSGPLGAIICIGLYPGSAAVTAGLIQQSLDGAYRKCLKNCCPDLG